MRAGAGRRGRACRPVRSSAPLAHLVPGQETLARPSVPVGCEPRKENLGETKAVPGTAVQRLLSRRDIPLREKALWRVRYETAARAAEILEIDVQDLDLDNRQAPIRSKGGAIQWVYRDTGTAHLLPRLLRLPGGASRTSGPLFLSERKPVPSRPAGPRPATSARTPAGPASAMTAAASYWTTTPAWSSTSSGTAPRPTSKPAELHQAHHSAGTVNACRLRCSVRLLSGAKGNADRQPPVTCDGIIPVASGATMRHPVRLHRTTP
jgi:integrase